MSALSNQIGNGTLSISSLAEDQALNAGLTQFQIGSWQALTPQAWYIDKFLQAGADIPDFLIGYNLQNYPYAYVAVSNNATLGVWAGVAGTAQFNLANLPVAQATIQQLLSLGVNIDDVLGQRNGWQNIPSNDACFGLCIVPPDTASVSTPPVIGAPATLTILGGGQETAQTYTCASLPPVPILKQSTPVYSVFPEALTLQVQDANGFGVPNATIQISGLGLDPGVQTVLTDINGLASVSLLADGLVHSDYLATLQVTSPAQDSSFPACAVFQQYDLENTPGATSGTGPTGLQTVLSVSGKSGTAKARVWTIDVEDTTGSATAMTLNSFALQQTHGVACTPVIATAFPAAMTGPDASGNFTLGVTTDFSSCKGLTAFTATVSATGTITLTDGTSYPVPTSGTIANQMP
jgi:hypothetical protein